MSDLQSVCPGCCAFGGVMTRHAGQIWHERCWAGHLEGALRILDAYYSDGSPDEDDVVVMGRVVDDALAGRAV